MRVLFLGMEMWGLHGSFLHIYEYAMYFRSIGAEVVVGGAFIGPENKKILTEAGISLYRLGDIPLDEKYDIVYALHLLIFPALLASGLKYDHAILFSLSSQINIEGLPPSSIWPHYDFMAVISEEIRNVFYERFGIEEKLLTVIPNHIPLNFLKYKKHKKYWSKKIKKVCVVSNHFVPEIVELAKIAPFQIDFFGSSYKNSIKITPDILLSYDVIITIGKTVQYSLALGIPVFEYDHFGGCGYILLKNILEEEKTNFSGRGTNQKLNAKKLLDTLTSEYHQACSEAPVLRDLAVERYSIEKLVQIQLAALKRSPDRNCPLNMDAKLFCSACVGAVLYIARAQRAIDEVMELKKRD